MDKTCDTEEQNCLKDNLNEDTASPTPSDSVHTSGDIATQQPGTSKDWEPTENPTIFLFARSQDVPKELKSSEDRLQPEENEVQNCDDQNATNSVFTNNVNNEPNSVNESSSNQSTSGQNPSTPKSSLKRPNPETSAEENSPKRKYSPENGRSCKKLLPEINNVSNRDAENNRVRAMRVFRREEPRAEVHRVPQQGVVGVLTPSKLRSVIPTRDNPPPEMADWLYQFQCWSNAERILAINELIERCEPTQVRYMMQVIEPQFQRDFISLLPGELALNVLSLLDPKDILRASETCRSWRFLAEDNLLWKEKCKEAGIMELPKRKGSPKSSGTMSPWKAAYMRHHMIETNWRSKPIKPPKMLKGHDDHVITCLQFCGSRIVSGSDDNTLKVWSVTTGKCLRTLVGHTGGVWSSQMSGNTIISGSTDRTLKVWDIETGVCKHTLSGHTSTVRCMHLHGNKVVSGSRDATLRIWNIDSGACLNVLVGHMAAVRCVQYDGKLVVSGAYDYSVKVWNAEKGECLHTLQGHTNRVYSLQFDGVHVVSGSLDTSIRVWDVESGACKHTLMGHQSLTSGMELRNNILVSGNADSTVKVWNTVTGQCLQTLSGPYKHQSAVTCLQFNNRFVITSSDDGTVKLWDVKTGEFIRNLVALESGGSGGVVWRIRASETKLVCAVGSRNGTEETKLLVLDFDVQNEEKEKKKEEAPANNR